MIIIQKETHRQTNRTREDEDKRKDCSVQNNRLIIPGDTSSLHSALYTLQSERAGEKPSAPIRVKGKVQV